MGFAEGFSAGSSGMQGAISAGLAYRRQEEEMALRRAQEARAAELHQNQMSDRAAVMGAVDDLGRAQRGDLPFMGPDGIPSYLRAPDESNAPSAVRPATPMEINQAVQRVALARRDMDAFDKAYAAGRTLEEDDLFSQGVKEADNPEHVKWLNTNHRRVSMEQPDKDGFTRFSVTTPDGNAMFGRLSAADRAQVRGALKIMERNPTRAMQILKGVDANLAATIAEDNKLDLETGKQVNEGAYHKGAIANQRISAQAAATSAGASALQARSHANYYDELVSQSKAGREDLVKARQLDEQFSKLSPEEQAGPQGRALIRQFNILNAKPGAQLSTAEPGAARTGTGAAGRRPLTELERQEAHKQAQQDISALPVPMRKAEALKQIYISRGLDPAEYGVETALDRNLKAMQTGGAPGGPAAPQMALRPYYNARPEELQRIALRPRGVSPAEAQAAADELQRRQGEGRMSAF